MTRERQGARWTKADFDNRRLERQRTHVQMVPRIENDRRRQPVVVQGVRLRCWQAPSSANHGITRLSLAERCRLESHHNIKA